MAFKADSPMSEPPMKRLHNLFAWSMTSSTDGDSATSIAAAASSSTSEFFDKSPYGKLCKSSVGVQPRKGMGKQTAATLAAASPAFNTPARRQLKVPGCNKPKTCVSGDMRSKWSNSVISKAVSCPGAEGLPCKQAKVNRDLEKHGANKRVNTPASAMANETVPPVDSGTSASTRAASQLVRGICAILTTPRRPASSRILRNNALKSSGSKVRAKSCDDTTSVARDPGGIPPEAFQSATALCSTST
mmetsp:Transcript_19547/g.56905  ORF Transcript_19547/g.56905 Transcript_19547/m.56905 type:complete len:246 (+) Transcript_19547:100-837(+)